MSPVIVTETRTRTRVEYRRTQVLFFNKKGIEVGALLILVGLIMHIVGMATPHWAESRTHHTGIWQICSKYFAKSVCVSKVSGSNVEGWLRGVQTVSAIGLIFAVGAAACMVSYFTRPTYVTLLSSGGTSLLAGMLVIIGVIVFDVEIDYWSSDFKRDWSIGVEGFGGSLLLLSGVVLLITVCLAK